MSFRLSRRTLLRGAGALVALPTLEAMLNSHGTAYAAGDPIPQRLCTFFFGNGVVLPNWVPSSTGANYALSDALSPLANVQSYVNVVSGCNIKTPNLRGHHNGCCALLSGTELIPLTPQNGAGYASKFGGPSIDQVAASIIGQTTTFASLQLAVSKRVTTGEGPTLQYMSHKGPDAPIPPLFNPVDLYNKLFGNFTPKDPTDPRDKLRVSVLDAVKDDAKRLQQKLGANDRMRLDQHLTAISEVRTQINALPPVLTSACVKPTTATTQTNQDQSGAEPMEAVSKAMSDLLVLAWACDLTRVASYQFTGSVGGEAFPMIGIPDNEHDISHDTSRLGDIHACVKFCVKNFAYLCEQLKASPEGSGNLLDNSVLMMTTDVAEGWVHSIDDYPVVLAGRGGGVLKYPGVHYRSSSGRNTSDILMTVMKAAGTGVASVGSNSGYSNTAIAELLA